MLSVLFKSHHHSNTSYSSFFVLSSLQQQLLSSWVWLSAVSCHSVGGDTLGWSVLCHQSHSSHHNIIWLSVFCRMSEFCVTISQHERGFVMILHNYDTNIFENTGLNNCSWLNCTNSSVSLFSRNNFGRLFACNYSSCHIYIDRCRSLFFSRNNVVSSLI